MKPLPDPQLNRLLAGRDELTQADKDAALEQIFERLPADHVERPAGLLAPWLRWALVGLGLLLVAPIWYFTVAQGPVDQFTARGPADAKPSFAVVCAETLAEGKCAKGGKLLFRVEPRGARRFAALAIAAGGGAVVWYFTDVGIEGLGADGLLAVGVPLGPEHAAGRHEVVGVFSNQTLTKDEIRALLEAPEKSAGQGQVVRRALEVTP
ncbi:MAG TPA: hypothetical protein VGK67_31605 [Myxococcales bacterium]|jgi:hypothetical protein